MLDEERRRVNVRPRIACRPSSEIQVSPARTRIRRTFQLLPSHLEPFGKWVVDVLIDHHPRVTP